MLDLDALLTIDNSHLPAAVIPIIFFVTILPCVILMAVIANLIYIRSVEIIPVIVSAPIPITVRIPVIITSVMIPVYRHTRRGMNNKRKVGLTGRIGFGVGTPAAGATTSH